MFVCNEVSQGALGVRSSARDHRGYLHPSLVSYPGGTESPGGSQKRQKIFIISSKNTNVMFHK